PLAYAEFTRALSIAHVVLTDSGGVQEEAPSLGKPVLVMRENTERPEAVIAGTVKLIGTHPQRLVDEVSLLLASEEAYAGMATAVNPYGDGDAAKRTLAGIRWKFLGADERPEDFLAWELLRASGIARSRALRFSAKGRAGAETEVTQRVAEGRRLREGPDHSLELCAGDVPVPLAVITQEMEHGGVLGVAPGERQELLVVIDAVAEVLDARARVGRSPVPLLIESIRHELCADAALRRRGVRGMAMDEVVANSGVRRPSEIQPRIAQQRQAVREVL